MVGRSVRVGCTFNSLFGILAEQIKADSHNLSLSTPFSGFFSGSPLGWILGLFQLPFRDSIHFGEAELVDYIKLSTPFSGFNTKILGPAKPERAFQLPFRDS